jgi:hypothetical protein
MLGGMTSPAPFIVHAFRRNSDRVERLNVTDTFLEHAGPIGRLRFAAILTEIPKAAT